VRTWRIAPALLLACSARSASRTPVERPDAAVEQAEVGSDLAEDIGDDSGNDLGNDAGGDLGNDLGNDLENQEAGSADVSDGGGDGARDGARDLSRCIPIGPPPREFALTKLTEAQQFYVPPSIQIGGDGTVRVIFLDRGAPDSEDLTLWAAVLAPPAGAAAAPEVHLVKLASSLHSTASPRVAVTRTGELRMVYSQLSECRHSIELTRHHQVHHDRVRLFFFCLRDRLLSVRCFSDFVSFGRE